MSRQLEALFRQLREQHSKLAEILPGGLADKVPDNKFNPANLAQGMKVEKEHTSSPILAKEIAKDHLKEDPNYYNKLKMMESADKSAPKFSIKSRSGDSLHNLRISNGKVTCSCPGYRYRQSCHHVAKFKEGVLADDLGKHGIQKMAELIPNILIKLSAERDYKDEYAKFQSSRESKVDRAHRNKVRRRLLASGRVRKHDGKDIDHRDGNPRNNGGSNISVTSKSYNRGKH